jgi:dienelactone hydrolase
VRDAARVGAVFAAGAIALALAGGGSSSRPRTSLAVLPARALIDAPFRILVRGLAPNERVKLVATESSTMGRVWRSAGLVRAGARGTVDARHSLLLGTMRPRRRVLPADIFPRDDSVVKVKVFAGKRVLATAIGERLLRAPSVMSEDERPDRTGFWGEFFRPAGSASKAGILLIGGSAGGVGVLQAALLASRGYPALAIAYFDKPGLPSQLQDIPLEYFERALEWLGRQPGVDANHLVALGVSRGAEAALLVGATFPNLVHAVVEYVGGANVGPASPYGGRAAWTLNGKEVPPGPEIPVERIAGPVFAVGGGADAVGASDRAARQIGRRLRAHRRSDFVVLTYPRAGHGLGRVIPNVPTSVRPTIQGVTYKFGGTRAANAAALVNAWPKLLAFLRRLQQ